MAINHVTVSAVDMHLMCHPRKTMRTEIGFNSRCLEREKKFPQQELILPGS